jgi:hypothetical protein
MIHSIVCLKFCVSAGIAFLFFSREGSEPRHIHVEQAERYAKFWLDPIELVESRGFRGSELRELHSIIAEHRDKFIVAGMSTLVSKPVADAVDVKCTDDELIVTLVDGRRVSAPLAWFPRLLRATVEQRANWRLIGRGIGIHWEDVDEDILVRTLLAS